MALNLQLLFFTLFVCPGVAVRDEASPQKAKSSDRKAVFAMTTHHFESVKTEPQSDDEMQIHHAMLERSKIAAKGNATANNSAFVCHDLCVVCNDGERAIFIKRGQSFIRKLINVALIPTAIAATAVAPWATLIAGGVFYLADKNFADKLGPECPSLQILQFDGKPGSTKSMIHRPNMNPILKDRSNPVMLLSKNLDKMFKFEEDEKKKAAGVKKGWFSSVTSFFVAARKQGQMTDLIMRLFDDSQVFCADHGKTMRLSTGPAVKEQSTLGGMWSAATGGIQKVFGAADEDIGFASTCREFFKINAIRGVPLAHEPPYEGTEETLETPEQQEKDDSGDVVTEEASE